MLEKPKRPSFAVLAIGALVVVTLAAAGMSAFRGAVQVEVAKVDRGPVAFDIVDEGVIRVHDVFVVSAPLAGRVSRIEVRPGDHVRRGQILARIGPAPSGPLDPRAAGEANAAVSAARAGVVDAEAVLALAESAHGRVAKLAERGIAAPAALDRAETELTAARAALSARRAELARAQAILSARGDGAGGGVVRAPVSGRVLQLMQESEAIVGPGAAILSLGDTEEIEAVGEFLSQDAVRISAGARAFVEDWGGPPLAARVERVEPFARLRVSALGVEEQRANIIARFDDAATAAARLGHGYRVNLRVVVSSEDDALRVPIEALVRDAQGWSVFRIENAHARRVRVELGEANGAFRPVASGLSEGDVVVMFPPPGLEEGGRVKIS